MCPASDCHAAEIAHNFAFHLMPESPYLPNGQQDTPAPAGRPLPSARPVSPPMMEATQTMVPPKSLSGNPESAARRVYLMKDLPPEVVAVAFAKTSRSPDPFDKIADELTEAKSAKFHERWVVGYGHASVAEHAVLSIALENVSILAAKAIEDNRLASYTEKSTRYQIYDPHRVYRPASFAADPELSGLYEGLVTELLTTYIAWSGKAIAFLKNENPRLPDQSPGLWESQMRARACDAIRYLLPTATLTNL
ncbi:MAG TPA: FAD-dependent thymidylate synthase, partial [Acidobacteriota bacterium]|nr:FAD-dependent thymidylate synthase [Acidobacteriota bacterium]